MRRRQRRAMTPECPYCRGRDIKRGEVVIGASFGPNRIPPNGRMQGFIIYCGFCGCTTVMASSWEEAEAFWAAGAPDGDFGPDGRVRCMCHAPIPGHRTERLSPNDDGPSWMGG
jgi:hypothetical protein